MEPSLPTNLAPPQSNRKILMVGGPKHGNHLGMDIHEIHSSKNLESSLEKISEIRPDLVIYFTKDKAEDIEEHVMTWLIEGFRGKFVIFDPKNRIKDSEVLMESQVIDEYYSGPVSPTRFNSIVKSQMSQDLRFANPRAMTTFDLFRNLFDRGLNAIFFFAQELEKCVAANLKAEKITGHTLFELRHLGLADLLHKDHLEPTIRLIRRAGRQYYDVKGMTVIKNRLNQNRIMSYSCGVFNFGRKSFVKFEVQDQPAQVVQVSAKAGKEVGKDPITHLATQEEFLQAINDNLTGSKKSQAALSLILCNLKPAQAIHRVQNRPKEENVMFKDLAKILQKTIRQTDTLARLGHYQFGILVPKMTKERVRALIKRLNAAAQKVPAIAKGYFEFETKMAQCPPQAYPFMNLLHSSEIPTHEAVPRH